ncbi:MAG: ABC transporter substrate-binding protein, partial [Clostridia bacterium]|nr:ABC transporter substrate-binding protein [Clostridia bacterium]
ENEEVPTLTWYLPGESQNDLQLVLDTANEIIEPEIGAKLDIKIIDSTAYTQKMNMILATGQEFDICFTGYINPYATGAKNGSYVDITDMIDTVAPKLRDVVEDYAFESTRYMGRIYAVPNMQIMAGIPSLIMQKKYADKYGFNEDSIKTFEDIVPFLEKIKQNEPDVFPIKFSGIGQFTQYSQKYCNGVTYKISDDYSQKIELVTPQLTDAYRVAAQKARDWSNKGYIRLDILSVGNENSDWLAGKYAVGYSAWKPGADAELKNTTGIEWVRAFIQDMPATFSTANNALTAISRTSKHPELALKLIELVNTNEELFNILSFGIEGKHYTTNSDGKIKLLGDSSGYFINSAWKFGNQFLAKVQEGQDDDVWEQTKKINESLEIAPLVGFVLDTTNISVEMSQVSTVVDKYKVAEKGGEDPDKYWDKMIAEFKAAGCETILKEAQRQVDEFLAQKNK